MTKDEYLKKLEGHLRPLSLNERDEILQDYAEHFEIGLEKGNSTAEIIEKLGSPEKVSQSILMDYEITPQQTEALPATGYLKAIFTTMALTPFNFFLLIGPFFLMSVLLFVGWVIPLSIAAASFLSLILVLALPFNLPLIASSFFAFAGTLALCGIGIIAMKWLSWTSLKIVYNYLQWNAKLIKLGAFNEQST